MTQEDRILADLKAGKTISPLDALHDYGTMRLGARCYDLKRKGYPVKSKLVKSNGKHYAAYYLEQEEAVRNHNLSEETRINLGAIRR